MSNASHDPTSLPVALARGSHRPQLDALRCFAVLGVLVTHFWQPAPLLAHVDLGFLGVRLFFVLSGFLITGILLEARDEADLAERACLPVLGRFYIRRVLRIFPLYYLIVLGGTLVGIPAAREAWSWLLTYTSNFYEALQQRPVGYFGHFWTLAVEEQFYMLMPWFLTRIFVRIGWEFPAPGPARLLVASAVTMVVAMASWRFFERPINDLKRFVPYQRRNLASARAGVPAS